MSTTLSAGRCNAPICSSSSSDKKEELKITKAIGANVSFKGGPIRLFTDLQEVGPDASMITTFNGGRENLPRLGDVDNNHPVCKRILVD